MTREERNRAFGAKIFELRSARKVSQRFLAEQVGLSSGFLSRLERGLYDPPSEEKIKALASALHTNPDSLLALAGRASSDLTAHIVKQPEPMAEGVRQLGSFKETDLTFVLAIVAIFALVFSFGEQKPNKTEEYKAKWKAAFDKFRKETAHFSPAEQRVLIAEMKKLIGEWEKAVP